MRSRLPNALAGAGKASASSLSAFQRVAIGAGILLAEYALVAVWFDGGSLVQRSAWLSRFSVAGEVFTALTIFLTAGVLVHWRQLRQALSECSSMDSPSAAWGGAHFGAFVVCLGAAAALFVRARSEATELVLLVVAALAGVGAVVALARALLGSAAGKLVKVLGRAIAAGALLGLLGWQLAVHSRPLWPRLARATLGLSGAILDAVSSSEVYIDAAGARLAMGTFEVIIAEACSGIEGMALVAVFLGGYIYRFRSELVVSRALLLVPLAVALAWLANSLRIAALVAIGAAGWPDVAFGGFHSKAGWLLFCAIALGLVVLLNRVPAFTRAAAAPADVPTDNPTAGYCLPFLSLLAVSLATGLFAGEVDWLYPLRLVAAALALLWARRYWRDLAPTISWQAIAWGCFVFVVWLGFTPESSETNDAMGQALGGLSPLARAAWLACRLLGTALIVPVVEELAFRGFLQRRLVARDFDEVPYRAVGGFAVVGSAAAFGALHPSWMLGALAGVAYSLAARQRGQLVDAMVAHGTTNLLLAVWALWFGRLDLLA